MLNRRLVLSPHTPRCVFVINNYGNLTNSYSTIEWLTWSYICMLAPPSELPWYTPAFYNEIIEALESTLCEID